MSNLNGHLSASQREILRLRHAVAELETWRAEYSTVLNYLLWTNSGEFVVSKSKLAQMIALQQGLRVIKSVICDVTGDMTWTYGDEPPKEPAKLIVLP